MKIIKLFFFLFSYIQSFKNIKDCSIKNKLYIKNNLLMNSKESEEKYNLNWYVIGEKNNFKNN